MSSGNFRRGGRGGRAPFGGRSGLNDSTQKESTVPAAMLKAARSSGQLNLSNRGLQEVPESVWRINTDLPEESKNVNLNNTDDRWWEQVDLTKLILASNQLVSLSEDIKLLPALTVIDVHDNNLSSLPDAIRDLVNLQKLNISHNKLTSLPECVYHLGSLKTFLASHNQIKEITDRVGGLTFIEEFDISHNELTMLPRQIGYLGRVMKLNLSENKIRELPLEIGAMDGLRFLDLNHNCLSELPAAVGDLKYLEQLYLRHNKLTDLPLLKECKSLKELHVGNNAIQKISVDNLQCLSALSVLDIRDNKVAELPDEITLLEQLQRLDLTNNDLSTLPNGLGLMTKLKSIVLTGNPMKKIRNDIVMRGTNAIKKYLASRIEEPELNGNQAEKSGVKSSQGASGVIGGSGDGVDPFAVATSRTLDYSNKSVSVIPDDIWDVLSKHEVHILNLGKNALTEMPPNTVLAAEGCKDLTLGFNRIQVLSKEIGLFMKLQNLDLRNNLLSDLPPEMASLQLLQGIILSHNRLKKLPPVLFQLKKLESLLINDNQISDVDAMAIKSLPVLSVLNLQNNDIMQVPPELGNCTQLRSCLLEGNPFRIPRPAILAKGTDAVLDWLRGRIPT
ncbi:leucine-rich repeat-containing protein 40-like [Lineus longissimus]|uniref:leucine-rich repeat-containing protein 40-like n=1 Tax=Lineus longissimus TaxID=88925 RepID=UPI002B4C34EF